ncbi:ORC-CDC6 family AAA ATPase [Myxococcus xanthus]|uniref:Uncharacterized protein n=1 Tax=Myxococcus xanthus TaxID=34 RepID=A0A7Y4IQG9_MYXXA|nr:hypothetical protein [Myxococcus xanthus]NOJ83449.1 hypothetical protein [Myxococcus xanthus]NOJ91010.1 hypothetical protein [Myxococcus xanthus]
MPTTHINQSLMRIAKRAETQSPEVLVKTFVDIGPLFSILSSRDNQVLYGRRGTGKTHALKYLAENLKSNGDIAIFVDLRTIGSSGGIYGDSATPLPERGTRLLIDTLSAVQDKLVDFGLERGSPDLLPTLDLLADELTSVRVVGGSIELESSTKGTVGATARSTGTLGFNKGPKVEASIESSVQASQEEQIRIKEAGTPRHRVHFGAVARLMERVVANLPKKRLWLILDEWSTIPLELQPLLADLIRRALFPVPGIIVKIGAIEYRSRFQEQTNTGDYIGIELGADASADLDLDDYMVFGNDNTKAESFFQEMFYKHLITTAQEDGIPTQSIASSADFIASAFTQRKAFFELVRAAEGVPRDAINVASVAAQKANDASISMEDITKASRAWYLRDKESAIATEAKALLHWIVDDVIKTRQARAFLLEQGKDIGSKLVGALFDARVLHVIKRGVSGAEHPGVRFNTYAIDYGCYVDLRNTSKAPRGLFDIAESKHETDFVEVPLDDYRSIRRAVLDLTRFERANRR